MIGNVLDPNSLVIDPNWIDQLNRDQTYFDKSGFLGCCLFKVHTQHQFVELIYFVINGNYQAMHLGNKLMAKFIEFVKKLDVGVTKIVTYADNRAIKFFKKFQFFKLSERQQAMVRDKIEMYSLATLMAYELASGSFSNNWKEKPVSRAVYASRSGSEATKLGFYEESERLKLKEVTVFRQD